MQNKKTQDIFAKPRKILIFGVEARRRDTMGQQNVARDKEIFLEFASVAGLTLCHGQVDTPDPPQPDLVAMIEGVGPVAYELGEIIDQDLAMNYSCSADTCVVIREYYETMPGDRRVVFDQRFSGAEIAFCFSGQADLRKRRKVLPEVFEALCVAVLPENGRLRFTGTHLADVLKCVQVCWKSTATSPGAGPTFGAPGATCFDPSPLSILKKKLTKSYETHYPLELILHSDRRSLYAETFWLPAITAHLEEHLKHSLFRRIWVFERHPPRVVHVHPAAVRLPKQSSA